MTARQYKRKFLDVLKLIHKVEPSPGFSHSLGTTFYDVVSSASLKVQQQESTVQFELPVTHALHLPGSNSVALSTYMAIMDDFTTYSLMTADGGRPGVSVSMNMEACDPSLSLSTNSVLIIAKTRKLGRNLGFTSAEMMDASTHRMICHGSHVKFLPMGFPADLLFQYGWPVMRWWYDLPNYQPIQQKNVVSLAQAMAAFDATNGTFRVEPHHASLGGPVHGGCQAVVLELAASSVAASTLPGSYLQSISIEYMAKPNCKQIDTQVRILHKESHLLTLQVKLLCEGKSKAVGIFKYMTPNVSSRL